MQVGILVKEFPPDVIGGTETQTLRMARELEARGHDVTVYTKSYPGEESHPDPPFELVRIPNFHHHPFVSTLTFLVAATGYLLRDSGSLDVLQCMMIYPCGFIGYVVSLLTDVPYFAWVRGGDFYLMKDNPVKRWAMEQVATDTLVLVQAENVRNDFVSEFPESDPAVLGNGVDLPDDPATGDAVTFVGRLKSQKGVDRLVRAMAEVDQELLVVGDGPRREGLESLASSLDVTATFVGEVSPEAVPEYLGQASVFVLPAVAGEGLPNAVLEAMAQGLPVVVSDVAGLGNAVPDGRAGYVVPPGDVAVLRDRIQRLLADETRRRRMGETAREHVAENYSWDAVVGELETYYRRVRTGTD